MIKILKDKGFMSQTDLDDILGEYFNKLDVKKESKHEDDIETN